jgi:hypothetical protein
MNNARTGGGAGVDDSGRHASGRSLDGSGAILQREPLAVGQ